MEETPVAGSNFIRDIIRQDLEEGKNNGRVHTRFPPEPNGYLHIGHAKAICLSFSMAAEFGGKCNLRFDDTNPAKEDEEYVASIQKDVRWLGFDWEDRLYYASDYFERMYQEAVRLIHMGLAYVDDASAEEIRRLRGTLTEPGQESPCRGRGVQENLERFERMRQGQFEEGSCVLRARIDMGSPNLNMRDPVIYRISKAEHHRTGTEWCIYPMYDYAHCLEDSFEGITHSLCTLEFEDHRPLYDWFLENLGLHHPQQIEFARLNLTRTVMSKRKLLHLVREGHVSGWDDPRMPTVAGLRRRGFTPESIRRFAELIGIAKRASTVDYSLLEYCIREDLNRRAQRVMGVLRPLKVVLVNYPEDQVEWLACENNPEDPDAGTRDVPFCREIYIEQEDFMEDPPKKFFRLSPGGEIRLKHAYYIRCEKVIRGEDGNIAEIHCTYDPESRGGWTPDGRKVRGTSHWVSARHAVPARVRLYDHLFSVDNPDDVPEGGSFLDVLNPESLEVLERAVVEPYLKSVSPGRSLQFLRQGYFVLDEDSTEDILVFNRTATLKDTWGKMVQKGTAGG